jgi:Asp-tRNA(Asn)/Glu-tRNA(Gln) amidotransferase A subunit family amidase
MRMISEFAASELPKDYYANLLSEIKEINKKLNAFNVVNEGISSGFPFSVKDNICVKGFEATAGSRMLKGYIPPLNATVVERLLAKDYGFVGKTAVEELPLDWIDLLQLQQAAATYAISYFSLKTRSMSLH